MVPTPFPAAEADLCVKCGLCLPHCPSYGHTGHEGDSPRGRIALMQALDSGQLEAGERLQSHLDGCLGCRACETVCPARVPYLRILDAGRAQLLEKRPRPVFRWLLRRLGSRSGQVMMGAARVLWQTLQPHRWGHFLYGRGRLGRLLSLLPDRQLAVPRLGERMKAPQTGVILWTGCTGNSLEPAVVDAAKQVLEALGHPVEIQGGCCGAMAAHGGLAPEAALQMGRLGEALQGHRPILGLASGCVAQLRGAEPGLSGRSEEVLSFVRRQWPPGLQLRPLSARVAVHRACTQRNALHSDGDLDWLLQQIPGVTALDIDPRATCCGAAGHHLLLKPEIADGHLRPKLTRLATLDADWVLSANVGCSLHLAGGLRRAGLRAPQVIHPLVLLARQWPAAAAAGLPAAAAAARRARSAGSDGDAPPRPPSPAPAPR